MRVVTLAGGTGGAKLARGLQDVCELTVIANTADDVEIHGAHVSPDPDLVAFTLADRIDARGWGLADDTFTVMEALRELHSPDAWFSLGDRDLAWCLERARLMGAGATLTQATAQLTANLDIAATVLPMCDEPVRTHVRAQGRWWPLQEFMIRHGARGPVEDVRLDGIEAARPTAAVLDALAAADVVVIGPSNPIISIGPILAVGGMRDALARGTVVAVSPLVRGAFIKGPSALFLEHAQVEGTPAGVARLYAGLIDGFVADEEVPGVPLLRTDVELSTPAQRRRVAEEIVRWVTSGDLARRGDHPDQAL